MQIFPCPFCGDRDEREFHFAGEAGKVRPDTARSLANILAKDWSEYLYTQRNDHGHVREIWMHLPCQEVFLLERNSVTMDVIGATSFRDVGTKEANA